MKNGFTRLLVAGTAIAVLGVAGCAPTGGTPSASSGAPADDQGDITSLVAAAQKEGTLTWYTEEPPALDDAAVNAFKAQFGIDVQYVALNSVPLEQKYSSEADSGAIAADVLTISQAADFYDDAIAKGWGMTLTDANLPVLALDQFPSEYMQGDISATVGISPFYMLYNKDTISGDMIPETLEDLTDPKYKGQLVFADPTTSDTLLGFYVIMQQSYGDGWFEQIRANDPKFYPTVSGAGQAMVAGEGGIAAPAANAVAAALQSSGAPVGTVLPPVTTGPQFDLMLTDSAKAPHPNAAKLFANWLLSESGSIAAQGGLGISPFQADQLPSGYQNLPAVTPEKKAEILKLLGISS